jgi:hypothetical protein
VNLIYRIRASVSSPFCDGESIHPTRSDAQQIQSRHLTIDPLFFFVSDNSLDPNSGTSRAP